MGPLVIFDQSTISLLPLPSSGGAPAIPAGGRRLLGLFRGRGWIRHSRAVLPEVEGRAEVEGVDDSKLRGGRELRVPQGFRATAALDRWRGARRLRGHWARLMVKAGGPGGHWLLRIAREGAAGLGRRWRRRVFRSKSELGED